MYKIIESYLTFSPISLASLLSFSGITKDLLEVPLVIALIIPLTFCGPILVIILKASLEAGDKSAAWIR